MPFMTKTHVARGAEIPPVNRPGEAGHASFASMACMAVILVVVMLGAVGCRKSSTGGGIFSKITDGLSGRPPEINAGNGVSFAAGHSFAHVVFRPGVKLIEKSAVDASIQGIGSDGHGVVFKNAPPEILALKAGDLLIVKNAFAAKILAAETDGDQTVLVTDRVGLADVLQQGEINVDVPINFHGTSAANSPQTPPFHLMDLIETPVYAQNGNGVMVQTPSSQATSAATSLLTSGWNIEKWSVAPAGGSANISARMTEDTQGFKAAVEMDGSISNFQFVSDIKFPFQGAGNQIISGVKQMSGKMHFVWEIGKGTPGVWAVEDRIKLPAGITIPLGPIFGGVPLTLDISSAFLIHPALTGGNEYSKGGFTIGWVGSNSPGDSGTEGLTFQITDDANVSPIAPNGMVISFCAPRIELKLGVLGAYGSSTTLKVAAAVIDAAISKVASKLLPPSVLSALQASPLGKMSVSNTLASSADVYVQVIHTEGVTHSSNMTLAPCTKIELKVTAQEGGDAKLFGLTDKATSTKDIFTKTYTEWNPGSKFCKSI
jgi:hypothetical protein